MEENLIKPDVVLVTRNVMVPLTRPAPQNKSTADASVSKKKVKIVKQRRNKVEMRQLHPFSHDTGYEYSQSQGPRRENPCGQFSGGSERYENFYKIKGKNRQQISSLSFPEAKTPEDASKLSCETLFVKKSSSSLKVDVNDNEVEDNSSKEDSLSRDAVEFEIFHKNAASRERIVTDVRRCVPNDANSKREIFDNQQNVNADNERCEIKYSWEDLDNWVPPSEKKKIFEKIEKKSEESRGDKILDCRIKYSWQIIGIGAQTSDTLIENLLSKEDKVSNYPCAIKYSWQIIGTGTQVSFCENSRDPSKYERDYWDGKILSTIKKSPDKASTPEISRKSKISYSENTQTTAEKILQTEMTNCRIKYSWENLTKPYLAATKNCLNHS